MSARLSEVAWDNPDAQRPVKTNDTTMTNHGEDPVTLPSALNGRCTVESTAAASESKQFGVR